MIRVALLVLSFVSLLMFPWLITAVLLIVLAFFSPVAAFALGVLADVLYFVPDGAHMPWGTVLGVLSFGSALLVHRFVKTRIMEA